MKTCKKILLPFSILILLSVLTRCISDYDGEVPYEKPLPVLNGILFADSLISVNLSWSAKVDCTQFSPITDAELILTENCTDAFVPARTDNAGNYYFALTAQELSQYSIAVYVDGFDTIKATTTIPGKLNATCRTELVANGMYGNSPVFKFNLSTPPQQTGAIYFFNCRYQSQYGKESTTCAQTTSIYCNSTLADQFNGINDSWGPAGYNREFETFVRFSQANIPDSTLKANFAVSNSVTKTIFRILNTTEEFDLYYKGSYLQRISNSFDVETFPPIAYQPVFLPTNVNTGIGIFAGVNQCIVTVLFE